MREETLSGVHLTYLFVTSLSHVIPYAVWQMVVARQPHGPDHLVDWLLSTVMVLDVQRQLDRQGRKRTVSFVIHGNVLLVQRRITRSMTLESARPMGNQVRVYTCNSGSGHLLSVPKTSRYV